MTIDWNSAVSGFGGVCAGLGVFVPLVRRLVRSEAHDVASAHVSEYHEKIFLPTLKLREELHDQRYAALAGIVTEMKELYRRVAEKQEKFHDDMSHMTGIIARMEGESFQNQRRRGAVGSGD